GGPGDPGRPIVAFDPAGDRFDPGSVDPAAVLSFGSERDGLTGAVLDRADRVVSLPMADGVSSLNLATSVAAATYALAFCG
ncbi:MAG: TrmH family RNA methyltransferase, partial [Actinomycetota bacterium]